MNSCSDRSFLFWGISTSGNLRFLVSGRSGIRLIFRMPVYHNRLLVCGFEPLAGVAHGGGGGRRAGVRARGPSPGFPLSGVS